MSANFAIDSRFSKHVAHALLVTSDGILALQHRDDLPEIKYPGFIHLFGGHVEKGESPLRAVARELEEEVGLVLPDEEFREYFCVLDAACDKQTFIYIVRGVKPESLKIMEGQAIVYASSPRDLEGKKVTGLAWHMSVHYWQNSQR